MALYFLMIFFFLLRKAISSSFPLPAPHKSHTPWQTFVLHTSARCPPWPLGDGLGLPRLSRPGWKRIFMSMVMQDGSNTTYVLERKLCSELSVISPFSCSSSGIFFPAAPSVAACGFWRSKWGWVKTMEKRSIYLLAGPPEYPASQVHGFTFATTSLWLTNWEQN